VLLWTWTCGSPPTATGLLALLIDSAQLGVKIITASHGTGFCHQHIPPITNDVWPLHFFSLLVVVGLGDIKIQKKNNK
jgi:hypothetical protein